MHFTHEWEKPVKAILDYFKLDDVTIIGERVRKVTEEQSMETEDSISFEM